MRIQGGIPVGGNLYGLDMLQAGNPFGPSGREGAIDVRFRQAQLIPGMIPMGNAGFFYGPQLGQGIPGNFDNKIVS